MNSVYGTTIIKPVETDTIIKDSRCGFEKCCSLDYDYLDNALEANGRYYTKEVKSVMSHFNYVHCGVGIPPMSKRIMNKVLDVSNDCGVQIYYQGTDSAHLNYDGVDEIVKKYTQKHNQDLAGDGLGNFHVDVSMDSAIIEIYGVECVS